MKLLVSFLASYQFPNIIFHYYNDNSYFSDFLQNFDFFHTFPPSGSLCSPEKALEKPRKSPQQALDFSIKFVKNATALGQYTKKVGDRASENVKANTVDTRWST